VELGNKRFRVPEMVFLSKVPEPLVN
jgi:hypothetical protein